MKTKNTPLSLAIGTAFVAGALATPLAQAAGNPFGSLSLGAGYQLAEAGSKNSEGSCGAAKSTAAPMQEKAMEGSCGAAKTAAPAKAKDASCGASKAKVQEASCGANKAKTQEASCGANKSS